MIVKSHRQNILAMQTRALADTGLTVSRACLGTMTFGLQTDLAAARSMVDLCLERGVNFFDTANVYNAGRSEEMLGQILAGRRDRVILATKVRGKMGEGPLDQGLSPAAIAKQIDDSLRRLQTDYVDLYYLHQPDYAVPLDETLAAVDALVRAGKVRHVAASNYAAWQLCRALWLADKRAWRPIRVVQPMYNLLARGIEQELLPMCREMGLATVIYNPLAGGLLTGKHAPAQSAAGTRFDHMPFYRDRYWNEANFRAVERLSQAARAVNRSLVGLAIAWLVHHTAADALILGASRLEQLEQNLGAMAAGALPAETLATIDEVWRDLRGVSPTYNR